ncbi:hypothetical protein Hanom_Chr10g00922721 [Helianthus anomalus]
MVLKLRLPKKWLFACYISKSHDHKLGLTNSDNQNYKIACCIQIAYAMYIKGYCTITGLYICICKYV